MSSIGQNSRIVRPAWWAVTDLREDRRVERTRSALRDAFRTLFFEHGYDQIGMADIAECANLARSTVYQHYRGKDDLLRDTVRGLFSMLADSVLAHSSAATLRFVIEHFWSNRGSASSVRNESTRRAMVRILAGLIEERFERMWPDQAAPSDDERRLAAFVIAQSQIGVIVAWMIGDVVADVDQMTATLHATTRALTEVLLQP